MFGFIGLVVSAEILHFFGVIDAPNRIRELRMAKKLSQQALGDAIRVSKVTISDLERGKMRLDLEYMRKIAPVLGVQPADLMPLTDNPYSLSGEERRFIERLREGTPEQREQIHKVADVILPQRDNDGGALRQAS